MIFLRPVLKMDQRSWVESHVLGFSFFGGAVLRVVPDNLKTGVIKPDLYDPLVNRAFMEFATYYGCLIDPARALKPRDKGRVERPVPYARDSFYAGRAGEFGSLVAMQADALCWCAEVANVRKCRPLEGARPIDVFDAHERHVLLALPRNSFELASWSRPKVHPDIHVKVRRTLYSVPWRLIGQQLDAKESLNTVEFFSNGTLVKTHARQEKGKVTDHQDYPPEKIAFFQRGPTWCRLADKYGPGRVERACARATQVGDPTYRTVKGILIAGTEDEDPAPAKEAPTHLHGASTLLGHLGNEAAS